MRVSITISDKDVTLLHTLGDGDLSFAVRYLIQAYRDAQKCNNFAHGVQKCINSAHGENPDDVQKCDTSAHVQAEAHVHVLAQAASPRPERTRKEQEEYDNLKASALRLCMAYSTLKDADWAKNMIADLDPEDAREATLLFNARAAEIKAG